MLELEIDTTHYDDYPFSVRVWINKTYIGVGRFCKDIDEATRYIKEAYQDYEATKQEGN